jgi:hypothetical protein
MGLSLLKKALARFRGDTSGVIVVEMVITLPLLILALGFTYEFFEIFRYKSIRDKATYVIADMISREALVPGFVDGTYMDNSLTLFNDIVTDPGVNQLRVTIIKFENSAGYTAEWSKIRGTGSMQELVDADILADLAHIPDLNDGEELILVDSTSSYTPTFNIGFGNNIPMASRTFTSFREVQKLCWGNNAC